MGNVTDKELTKVKLVEEVQAYLAILTKDKRADFICECMDNYCPHCGGAIISHAGATTTIKI